MIRARAYGLLEKGFFFPARLQEAWKGEKKWGKKRLLENKKHIFWEEAKLGSPASLLRAAWDAQPNFWDAKPSQPSSRMALQVFDHPTSTADPTTANSDLFEIGPNTSQTPVIQAMLDSGANTRKFKIFKKPF